MKGQFQSQRMIDRSHSRRFGRRQSRRLRWPCFIAARYSVVLPVLIAYGCGKDASTKVASRVLLVQTEFLESPAVETTRNVFKPAMRIRSSRGLEADAFRITVDAGTADLLVQATRRSDDAKISVPRVEPYASEDFDFSRAAEALADEHECKLERGTGFFWVESSGENHLVVSLVLPGQPEKSFHALRVSATAIDDIPVTGVQIELAVDFFYMIVVGDSVQWGNGLNEGEKMSALVIRTIEAELGRTVILQRYAHSGATIFAREGDGFCEFNCFGEVPKVNTSILAQVDQVIRPDLVEFVLTDGCINDVNVANIVNPTQTPESIAQMTGPLCLDGMTELLRKIRTAMPSAAIVVTGYFQIVSPLSDVIGLNAWLQAQGQPPSDLEEELIPVLTANSVSFHDIAHARLQEAISVVGSETADSRIAFADPGFGENNAIFAPDAWLWGMTADDGLLESLGIELDLAPMDDSKDRRIDRCIGSNLDLGKLIVCLYASVGHPTPAGSRAYATAIEQKLRELGVLPQ